MIFKHQKILLTLELIAVIAVTIYSGSYALNAPAQVAVETVAETEMESTKKTAKESKEESETKKSKEKKTVKETKKKDKKSETKAESETVKKVAENKDKSDKKDNTSSGNTANASGNKADNNSAVPASGTASKPAGNATPATKPSGSNNSRPAGNGSSTSAPSGGTSSTPAPVPSTSQTQTPETTPAHTHNWIETTRTVHHEATGHYEDVVVQEAWDEPVYETAWKAICNGCGGDITSNPSAHIEQQMLAGNMACSGHTDVPYEKIVDYTHHDAVTESRWVEDTPAWDETVSDGYTCSGCGATK